MTEKEKYITFTREFEKQFPVKNNFKECLKLSSKRIDLEAILGGWEEDDAKLKNSVFISTDVCLQLVKDIYSHGGVQQSAV